MYRPRWSTVYAQTAYFSCKGGLEIGLSKVHDMLYDTRSSRPNSILVSAYYVHNASVPHGYTTNTTPTLQKLLQKRALWSLVHLEKNTHHMVGLLPTVESLLKVLAILVYEHLNRAWIRDMPVCLKLFAYAVSDVCWGDGDSVQGDDFGCLRAFPVVNRRSRTSDSRLTARIQAL